MERAVALKKLRPLLGKSMGYRVDPKAPIAEERAEAKAMLSSLTQEKERATKALQARREAVLAADQEYQEAFAVYKRAREQLAKASSMTYHYKFTVGTCNGLFFHVKASGDSWEDVIAKLTSK